jgi:hydrogenase/urease accessory protein HupE
LLAFFVVFALGVANQARAHPLAPSVLSFEHRRDDTVTMSWRAPVKRPTGQSLRPKIPDTCVQLSPARVEKTENETAIVETIEIRCDPADMLGAVIRVDGFEDSKVTVVVRIASLGSDVHHAILDSGRPELTIVAQVDEAHSFFEYLMLGVGHLLSGWDHLTFVLGLLVLFGWNRRLIAAVTAFTVGHSLTLALSVLRIVSLPAALVEASIALTIVILALEIQSGKQGPVWKHPWILPGALGLLHGLGFASVLFDAGLPGEEIPLALLGFNLGLEVAQLGVIAVAWLSFAAVRSALPATWRSSRTIPAYVIGSLAAFWFIERMFAAFCFTAPKYARSSAAALVLSNGGSGDAGSAASASSRCSRNSVHSPLAAASLASSIAWRSFRALTALVSDPRRWYFVPRLKRSPNNRKCRRNSPAKSRFSPSNGRALLAEAEALARNACKMKRNAQIS